MVGIYKITAQDGKIYIGKSRNIEKRWQDYISSFTKLSGQPDLYLSFKKYGWFNHNFEIIEECLEEELGCREFYWQHFYDVLGENGLNMMYGSCYDTDFQAHLFELNNSYFRNSVLRHLYKTEDIVNINFDIRKYRLRRGEKLPRKKRAKETKRRINYNPTSARNLSKGTREKRNKIVLDTETGVFYYSVKEVSELYGFKYETFKSKLNGKNRNNTQFIYA